MQKLVSKYATAAHLAFMTVAPLFLLPFFGEDRTAVVLLWLSLAAFVWVLMEPSRRRGELLHESRERVFKALVRDPLAWFMALVVLLAGVRALNGGVMAAWDAEAARWTVSAPPLEFLPGCVTGAGLLPFSVAVAAFVLVAGIRHALGRKARASFLVVFSFLTGAAATVLLLALTYGNAAVLDLVRPSYVRPSFVGTAFGLGWLGGLVAQFGAAEYGWMRSEPLTVLGQVANAVGLAVFAPPATIVVFAAALAVLAVLSFFLTRRVLEGSGALRCILAILIAFAAAALFLLTAPEGSPMANKAKAFMSFSIFPEGFAATRATLDGVARRIWAGGRWLGGGLGSFPLELRFTATPQEWALIPVGTDAPANGWWLLLSERGVVGAAFMGVIVLFLAATGLLRLIGSFRRTSVRPHHAVGPVAALALAAVTFADCSLWRADVLLAALALLALSVHAFPAWRRADGES